MLEELEVRGLGPIRHALLGLSSGMTAITGETGAGKSMLLDAIRLISGQSPDAGRVRSGDTESWAQGVFLVDPDGHAAAVAQEAGASLDEDGNELFLTRVVPVTGRSRAMLSGRSVPRSVLAKLADDLVTVHGQSDQLRIASEARQRDVLDAAAGNLSERELYDSAWRRLSGLTERLARLRSQETTSRERVEYLRASVARIDDVAPRPDEDGELKERRSRIEHAAQITQGIETALGALDASQLDVDTERASATELITKATQALHAIHVEGEFTQAEQRLESLNADLADIVFSLSHELDDEPKVEDLDELNARIHALVELTRNWGPSLHDVLEWRDKAVLDIEDLDASPEKTAELDRERELALHDAVTAARRLSETRQRAAKRLSRQVNHELSALAMRGSRLDITVLGREDAATLDAHGLDDIVFAFTPFPGSPRLPMGKSASGGELSRLMLALELSVASCDDTGERGTRDGRSPQDAVGHVGHVGHGTHGGAPAMTFIFDEVDAGVGGKAAVELGRRLALLARRSQVIVVTHLAQVASWADAQFVVNKGRDDDDATVVTTVHEVRGDARVREIARMLSGSESDASLAHARELIGESTLPADTGENAPTGGA